jgi:hypothetical protein
MSEAGYDYNWIDQYGIVPFIKNNAQFDKPC